MAMKFLPRQRAARSSPTLDAFADLIADGIAPRDAAEQIGKRRAYGDLLMVKLRQRLGPQAI